MDSIQSAFLDWQSDLNEETDFWGLRYIRPRDGGLIWRNRAACAFFEQFGFFPAATAAWESAKAWLGETEAARLGRIYARAFARFGEPVFETVTSTAAVTVAVDTGFTAVAGTIRHGLILTHFELMTVVAATSGRPSMAACI